MDWGEGSYERTAAVLAPLADMAVAKAGLARGERVLDVGTGSGNAAYVAARLGASVVGVDPAERLLGLARRRCAGLTAQFRTGTATALPVEDGAFDAALSVMGVIFEPDGPRAVAELRRAVRPGGRVVLTSWTADGAVFRMGQLLREAVATVTGPVPAGTDWTSERVLRALFPGCRVTVEPHALRFTAPSPATFFSQQEVYHPVWRQVRALVGEDVWRGVRDRSIRLLAEANEEPGGFAVGGTWLLVRADLP